MTHTHTHNLRTENAHTLTYYYAVAMPLHLIVTKCACEISYRLTLIASILGFCYLPYMAICLYTHATGSQTNTFIWDNLY